MFDSVIRFNAAYIEATPKPRIDAILEGLRLLAPTGLPVFTLAVWAMASLRLVSTSGRSLNHYFMAWLPISAVLAARFFRQLMGPSDESELSLGQASAPGPPGRSAWQS